MTLKAVAGALIVLGLAGCQTVARPSFSHDALRQASDSGTRLDTGDPRDRDLYLDALHQAARAPADGAFDLLALSSGGANGAYGAGVLVGWSERDRPEFEIVTGVSIGALMAPFAFVGRSRDDDLARMFTDGRTRHLLRTRGVGALVRPGLYRTEPLRRLVDEAVDERLLEEIAVAHRAGRRLYVATTSLDTREQVVWDLGALAASADPASHRRFKDILVASASVPGAFEPVLIDLDAKGDVREAHVDGRLSANFFVAPESVLRDYRGDLLETGQGRLWIVINGSPTTPFRSNPYSGLSVLGRSLEALLNASTRMSVIAAEQFGALNGLQVSVTEAEGSGDAAPLDFDPLRMAQLFELGRRRGRSGDAWSGGAATTQQDAPVQRFEHGRPSDLGAMDNGAVPHG